VIWEHPTWEYPIQDTLVVTRFQYIVGKHSSGQRLNLSLIELCDLVVTRYERLNAVQSDRVRCALAPLKPKSTRQIFGNIPNARRIRKMVEINKSDTSTVR